MFHSELFWVAVAFVMFLVAVGKPAGRMIINLLDARAARIQKELDEALRLKEEAQALLASYQRRQKEVMDEAAGVVTFAEEESRRLAVQAEQQLEDAINKRIELAMEKIASYEASVVQEIRNNAVDIAVSTVRSLITENMNREMAEDLIDAAIADSGKKLH